ncbi:MAG TPA: penicillin-binding protein 2, partial [Micromonospora sp.]
MAPRSDEPRRDVPSSRRGSARTGSDRENTTRGGRPGTGEPGVGSISDARAYTPRGRTVRESAQARRTPRSGRSADPFRPALQVLDGGRATGGRTAAPDDTRTTPPRAPG